MTISVDSDADLGIRYRTHVQTYGWQKYVRDGQLSGTSGESKRLEGIRIRLTGQRYSGGIQRRALVSRMDRQKVAVSVGDGPFSIT